MFINDMFNEDSWSAGDNAWSSEHDQWAKESVETSTNTLDEYKGAHDKVTFEIDSENAYNHVMQKYGNIIEWDGDYMTAPARYWPAIQELVFAAGGDVQEIELNEEQLDEGKGYDTVNALVGTYNASVGGDQFSPLYVKSPGTRVWTRGDGVRHRDPGRIQYENDAAAKKWPKAMSRFWQWLTTQPGVKSIGQVSGEFSTSAMMNAVRYGSLYFALTPYGNIVWGSVSRFKNPRSVWRHKAPEQGVAEDWTDAEDELASEKESASMQEVFNAITHRIERQMPELFTSYGVEVVANAIRDVAEFHEGAEELGSSDVGGMVREVVRQLKQSELRKALDEVKKLSTQDRFEQHLAKHGYDVNEKQKYWEKKIKDIDAQIAAWDKEMAARKQGVAEVFAPAMTRQPTSPVKRIYDCYMDGMDAEEIGQFLRIEDTGMIQDVIDDINARNGQDVAESVNSIVQQILSESRLGDFLPPFRANGLWIDDRRGNSVAEVRGHGSLAKEVANALNQYVSKKGVAEAKGLNKRVRVVKTGETGTIRQVKHGAFKGAPKSYFVDLDSGKQADNLPASALRLIKDGVAEGGEWDEYTGGNPMPDTDELDTYGGEHDLDESSGTEYRGFDIRTSRDYKTGEVVYWIYYRGRCTDWGTTTLNGAKKDIDRMIANGYLDDPDEAARKKQQGVAEGSENESDIDKQIEFHKQGQAAAQYKGSMNKMHAAKIRELEAKKQALKQGVAEGEYDDPRFEPREPDMSRKVDWDIEAERNKRGTEPASSKTVTITDGSGKVVLTFPSTGGYYGDVRTAKSKGFDTEAGDYNISWGGVTESYKNTYEVSDRVNTPQGPGTIVAVSPNVNVDGRVKVKLDDPSQAGEDGQHKDTFAYETTMLSHIMGESNYWNKLQKERYLKEHKAAFSLLDELQEVFKDK